MALYVMIAMVSSALAISGEPCIVQEVKVNSEPVMRTYVNYTFVGPSNCTPLRCDGRISGVIISPCENMGRQLYSFAIQKNERSGLKCVKSKGCVKLRCGNITSAPVYVHGLITNISISKPYFRSNKTLHLSIASYEQVKDWRILIQDENGRLLDRRVTRGSADQHIIHSNYTFGKIYTLLVYPILHKPDNDCMKRFSKKIIFNETISAHTEEPPRDSYSLKISLAVTLVFLVLAVACLAWRRNSRVHRRPPALDGQFDLLPSPNVMLVHTNESPELRARIEGLTETLQNHGTKVFDIYCERDHTMKHDPQAWLFSRITKDDLFVLVLTRGLGDVYQHLAKKPDFIEPHKILRRMPHAYDGNLITILKFLLDRQDDSRWVTIRFDDLEAEESSVESGPPELIGARLYKLPAHEKNLLNILNPGRKI
ncbi:uncharacterized protein LOC122261497 [Penaeus japonicus]|uniref:uncharacterized protein LOC122261497 n=1 Tax=Penaeus japonicus TaxID=27405 RepID=UPI001C70E122|nr:uncharacterized protein LOC122261497 [Penaeus japonicus]